MICSRRFLTRFLLPGRQLLERTSQSSYSTTVSYSNIPTLYSKNSRILLSLPSQTPSLTSSATKESGSRTAATVVRAQTMSFSSISGGDDGDFKLSESSVLKIKKGDITQWSIDGSSDAIVSFGPLHFRFCVFSFSVSQFYIFGIISSGFCVATLLLVIRLFLYGKC